MADAAGRSDSLGDRGRRSFLRAALALAFLPVARAASPASTPFVPVATGLDVLESERFQRLQGKRVGLLTNPTGLNRAGAPSWRVLRHAPGVRLAALFGAEPGFDGQTRAGIEVPNATHPETKLTVYSLYGRGPTRKPTPAMLKDLDVLIYDIQDTGCRSYTYISSMGLAMEACAEAGIEFMVLDRPNPLGGVRVEGPGLDPAFRSFVSQWPVPYVYGLTPGELARMINGQKWISRRAQLTVVPMRGWTRRMVWNDTGLRWTPSSPNVPLGESALGLVATGMLGELGGLNLGTGTPLSFMIIGSGFLDPDKLTRALNAYKLPGIVFERLEVDFNRKPADGRELRGTRLRFTSPATAPLTAINLYALEAIRKTSGRDPFKMAVQRGKNWTVFDKVCGSDRLRKAMQAGKSAESIVKTWGPGEEAFRRARQPYLLYPDLPAGSR